MAELTHEQASEFQNALVNAFPTRSDLARMVRYELDINLEEVGSGQSLQEAVSNVIDWAESHGRTTDLIRAALAVNPDNSRLKSFALGADVDVSSPRRSGIHFHGPVTVSGPIAGGNIGIIHLAEQNSLSDLEVQLEGAQFDFANIEADRTQQFSGRIWLFQEVEEWLRSDTSASTFLLLGDPGTGKTAVVLRLMQFSEGRQKVPAGVDLPLNFLSAAHICSTRISRTLDPRLVAMSLARQLAAQFPAFRQSLIKAPFNLADLNVQQVWDNVLVQPLIALKGESVTILIDSLDEAQQYKSNPTLVDLLAHTGWIKGVRWLMTTRHVVAVNSAFSTALRRDLIIDAPSSIDDVRDYALNRLRGTLLSLAERETLAQKIAAPHQGNFLYARHVLDSIEPMLKNGQKPSNVFLPPSLDKVYSSFLEHLVGGDTNRWVTQYQPLLGAIATALGTGLSFNMLQVIIDQSRSTLNTHLNDLRSYLSDYSENGPYRLYHQSFGDFLLNRTHNPLHWIDPIEAHGRTALRLIQVSQENWTIASDYAKRYVTTHLIEAIRGGETQLQPMLRDILTHRLYLKTRLRVDGGNISLLEQEYAYACELLPPAMQKELKQLVVEVRKGDIEVSDSQVPQIEVPTSPQTPQVTDDTELRRMLRNVLTSALPDNISRVMFLRDAGLSEAWIGAYSWDGPATTVAGQLIELGAQQGTPLKIDRPGYTVLGAVLTKLISRELVGLQDARYIAAALVNYDLIDFAVATLPPELGNLLTIK